MLVTPVRRGGGRRRRVYPGGHHACFAAGRGPVWSLRGDDMVISLLVFGAGYGVGEHVGGKLDVPLVGVPGQGVVAVDGQSYPLGPGQALLVPNGV